jgi:hypothetical protein
VLGLGCNVSRLELVWFIVRDLLDKRVHECCELPLVLIVVFRTKKASI